MSPQQKATTYCPFPELSPFLDQSPWILDSQGPEERPELPQQE